MSEKFIQNQELTLVIVQLECTTDTASLDLALFDIAGGVSVSWGGGVVNIEFTAGGSPSPFGGSLSWVSTRPGGTPGPFGKAINTTIGKTWPAIGR